MEGGSKSRFKDRQLGNAWFVLKGLHYKVRTQQRIGGGWVWSPGGGGGIIYLDLEGVVWPGFHCPLHGKTVQFYTGRHIRYSLTCKARATFYHGWTMDPFITAKIHSCGKMRPKRPVSPPKETPRRRAAEQ